jgi:predicted NBD/HSP70 family sugar kinase
MWPGDQAERLTTQASGMGSGELTRAAEVIAQGLTDMRGTTAPRLHLELMCARVLLPGADVAGRGIHARLDRLERRLQMDPLPEAETPRRAPNRPPAAFGGVHRVGVCPRARISGSRGATERGHGHCGPLRAAASHVRPQRIWARYPRVHAGSLRDNPRPIDRAAPARRPSRSLSTLRRGRTRASAILVGVS